VLPIGRVGVRDQAAELRIGEIRDLTELAVSELRLRHRGTVSGLTDRLRRKLTRWRPRYERRHCNRTDREASREHQDTEISVVIPCLNEAESIATCVLGARNALSDSHYDGEVVVVDNGSTDGSGALAAAAGARVILEPRRGYGNAYLAGLSSARGRYIVMLDADLTYDPSELPRFVQELEEWRRPGARGPDGGHPTWRHAVAASARRQPDAHRPAQPAVRN